MCRAALSLLLGLLAWGVALAANQTGLLADQLIYQVVEPGAYRYQQRILVTDNHLRIDEGEAAAGYVLYDRVGRTLYSISREERTVLVIESGPLLSPDPSLKTTVERVLDEAAPMIAGQRPLNLTLKVNGRDCEQRVVLPGAMPRAVAALAEYYRALAFQQSATVGLIPADMQDDCDLIRHVYAPDLLQKEGLAVQVIRQGRRDELVDFSENVDISAQLLTIPKEYEHRHLPNPRIRDNDTGQ